MCVGVDVFFCKKSFWSILMHIFWITVQYYSNNLKWMLKISMKFEKGKKERKKRGKKDPKLIKNISINKNKTRNIIWSLTVSETLALASSSARFSRALTHTFRFCRQREAAALFRSRKRRRRSSGSISAPRRLRPPFGGAGDTCGTKPWAVRSTDCGLNSK